MRNRIAVRITFFAALVSVSGCSLFMTRGPRSDTSAQMPPDCTTSMTWPVVDGVVAGVLTIAMISAISQDNNSMTSDDPDSNGIATGFIIAGAAGVGALVGHSRVSKCRRASETYMAQAYGGQQQPPTAYPYGSPQGYGDPQQYPQQPGYPQHPQQPTAYPVQQPPVARPNIPPVPLQPVIQKRPPPKQPDPVLGTEGDVCTAQTECAGDFTCTGNVCLKPK